MWISIKINLRGGGLAEVITNLTEKLTLEMLDKDLNTQWMTMQQLRVAGGRWRSEEVQGYIINELTPDQVAELKLQ